MSKDIWMAAYEKFEEEHGREPTDAEAEYAYAEYFANMVDAAKEQRKYGND